MAKFIVETFQVCLGTDASDPNPTVFARGFLTEEDALAMRDRMLEMQQNNQLDSALVSGKTFYTRASPGSQFRTIPSQDRQGLRTQISAGRFSFPIYVLTTDDADTNPQYVRIGTITNKTLR